MNLIRVRNYTVKIWHSAAQRVISLTFVGMLLGLLVDVLIAAKLGTSQASDALIIALSLPLLIDTVTREGTNFSLVPLCMERRANLSEVEYHRFASSLINLALAVGIGMTILFEAQAPWIVAGLAPGFSPEAKVEAAILLHLGAPLVIFAPGITVVSVLLNSQKRFSLVALRNSITPAIVVGIICLAWNRQEIVLWITAAYSIGFATFFLTLFLGVQKTGHQHDWLAWISKDDLVSLWQTNTLPTLGFIVRQGSRLVERQLASLVAVGGVASYYFAFRLFSAVQTLVGSSLATTSLPKMTEHGLAGDRSRLAATLRKNLIRAVFMTLPAVVLILLFHSEIIRWLYGRGSFNETSIQQSSQIFFCLGMGLAFFCSVPILQSGLYALRAYGLVFRNMFIVASANIFLAWLFSRWWGLVGIAVAVSLSAVLSVCNVIYLLHKSGVPLLGKKYRQIT
jgi:murein biosynthesis integral membrane protein MurJ